MLCFEDPKPKRFLYKPRAEDRVPDIRPLAFDSFAEYVSIAFRGG